MNEIAPEDMDAYNAKGGIGSKGLGPYIYLEDESLKSYGMIVRHISKETYGKSFLGIPLFAMNRRRVILSTPLVSADLSARDFNLSVELLTCIGTRTNAARATSTPFWGMVHTARSPFIAKMMEALG